MRSVPLDILNSATKYPSIETYHALGDRGRPTSERRAPPQGQRIFATEKVDGTNGRIIVVGDDYLIGSRNELLTARGDFVPNPAMGIVDALRPHAERLRGRFDRVTVFYAEVYGYKVGAAAKHYTSTDAVGVRLFDVAVIDEATLRSPTPEIAATARENGGQAWLEDRDGFGFDVVPMLNLAPPPEDPNAVLAWLPAVTQAGIDASGVCEGVVLRTRDRSWIVKARREDYARLGRGR